MNYRALAELQDALKDPGFVEVLHELSGSEQEPERSFARLLLLVARRKLGINTGAEVQ